MIFLFILLLSAGIKKERENFFDDFEYLSDEAALREWPGPLKKCPATL